MSPHPALAMAALVMLILCWMVSWSWLEFAKYPTSINRDNAARMTGWTFGFAGIVIALWFLTLSD